MAQRRGNRSSSIILSKFENMYYLLLLILSVVIVIFYDGVRYLMRMTSGEWVIGSLLNDKLPSYKRVLPFVGSVIIVYLVLLYVTFTKGKIFDI